MREPHEVLHMTDRVRPILTSLRRNLARFFCLDDHMGQWSGPAARASEPTDTKHTRAPDDTDNPGESAAMEPDWKWRRHPVLLAHQEEMPEDTTRDARYEAVRGLMAARQGATDVAIRHFAVAARQADLDLTRIPGFWTLDRSGIRAAIDAYEKAGRIRDAAALSARLRTRFRPRAIAPIPTNVTHLPITRRVAHSRVDHIQ